MDVWSAATSVATVGALLAALWQLQRGIQDARERDEDRRVERALQLYEDVISEGATHKAFHRLSVLLRRVGSQALPLTTWQIMSDRDLGPGGFLDPDDNTKEEAFADLYGVMWFFERCELSLERKLVSEDVLMATLGFHFWWWGQILFNLRGPKASQAVHRLAQKAEAWATTSGHLRDWQTRCETDFSGGPGQPLNISPSPVKSTSPFMAGPGEHA
jgi:hypothetical protein